MICIIRIAFHMTLGKREMWAETELKAMRILGANKQSRCQVQDGKPRFATCGLSDCAKT